MFDGILFSALLKVSSVVLVFKNVGAELLGLLIGLGLLLEMLHLIYARLLTRFGMLVFFTNLSLLEFWVRYMALFCLFLVMAASGSGREVFIRISS